MKDRLQSIAAFMIIVVFPLVGMFLVKDCSERNQCREVAASENEDAPPVRKEAAYNRCVRETTHFQAMWGALR